MGTVNIFTDAQKTHCIILDVMSPRPRGKDQTFVFIDQRYFINMSVIWRSFEAV